MKYAAFFRGLNVGGKNAVKMLDLRTMLTDLGLEDVRTYIQSGNAVFGADGEPGELKTEIETAFACRFGFASMVILRSRDEMNAMAEKPPCSANLVEMAIAANPNVDHVYIYFPDNMPSPEALGAIRAGYEGPDKLLRGEREIYLLCHESIRDSKMAAALAKLKIPMTARNWNTLSKMRAMLAE